MDSGRRRTHGRWKSEDIDVDVIILDQCAATIDFAKFLSTCSSPS